MKFDKSGIDHIRENVFAAVMAAEEKSALEVKALAVAASSMQRFSADDLRAMDHPFAIRHLVAARIQQRIAEYRFDFKAERNTAENRYLMMNAGYATNIGIIGASPIVDPGFINRQTGTFAASWHIRRQFASFATKGGSSAIAVLKHTLYNDAPYASYLERGTKYMAKRPFLETMIKNEAKLIRKRNLDAAIKGVKDPG
jgi:hypothetical protein